MICTFLQGLLQPGQIKGPGQDSPRGTFRVGRVSGGNSELRDLFKDLESNLEAKSSTRQARFWAAGFRHEKGLLGAAGIGAISESQVRRSPSPSPRGRALGRR